MSAPKRAMKEITQKGPAPGPGSLAWNGTSGKMTPGERRARTLALEAQQADHVELTYSARRQAAAEPPGPGRKAFSRTALALSLTGSRAGARAWLRERGEADALRALARLKRPRPRPTDGAT